MRLKWFRKKRSISFTGPLGIVVSIVIASFLIPAFLQSKPELKLDLLNDGKFIAPLFKGGRFMFQLENEGLIPLYNFQIKAHYLSLILRPGITGDESTQKKIEVCSVGNFDEYTGDLGTLWPTRSKIIEFDLNHFDAATHYAEAKWRNRESINLIVFNIDYKSKFKWEKNPPFRFRFQPIIDSTHGKLLFPFRADMLNRITVATTVVSSLDLEKAADSALDSPAGWLDCLRKHEGIPL